MCSKYEVSIFGHSKDIKGVPILRKWSRDLSHAPLGSNFHIATKGFRQCIIPENLECVTLSIRKLWRGSQILNLGHVTLTTPTLGVKFSCNGTSGHVTIIDHYHANANDMHDMSWSICAPNPPNMKFLSLVIPKI